MKTFKFFGKRAFAIAVPAIVSVLALSAPVQASTFGVRVVNDSGEPVSGAAVCVGLPGNYKQFGALFTDSDGQAFVEVPNVPLIVTVSKTRFSGTRLSEPARGFNLLKQITLSEGVPGPRCRAGSSMAANPPSIEIGTVEVSGSASSTMLVPSVSGNPSHYRVSTSPEFFDAGWQPYDNSIALGDVFADNTSVYLQMRRFEGNANAWLESLSDVVAVQLTTIR